MKNSQLFSERMVAGEYPDCVKELWTNESCFISYDYPGRLHKGCPFAEGHEDARIYRYRLEYEDKVYGVLGVTLVSAAIDNEEEQALFMELAGDISFALANIEMQAEREKAEELLRTSEKRYRTTLDSMMEGCQIIGFGWRYMYVNNIAAKHGRRSKEELLGHTMMEIYPGIEKTRMFARLKRCMEKRVHIRMENVFTYPDGSQGWFEISFEPVPEGVFILSLDITERKQAEEAIERESVRRRILIEGSRDGIVVLDQNGKVYESNRKFNEMIGYSGDEVKELYLWDWDYRIPRKQLLEMVKTVDETGDFFETRHRRKDGTVYDVEISTNAAMFGGQKLIFCVCRDITERKKADEALRASEEQLRLLFESITDGITIVGLDGKIIRANEASVLLHGYDTEEKLTGKKIFDFLPQTEHPAAAEYIRNAVEGKAIVKDLEVNLTNKDGKAFTVEMNSSVIRDRDGKPVELVTFIKDITERKKMEEQLIVTDRLASIGELASGIAHELNNPLTGVIGLSQLLTERDVPGDIKEDLRLIYSEAQRAAGVVKNMLAFARKHPAEKQPVSVNSIIDKVMELRAYEQKINNIEVVTNLAPGLPQIMGDYFQLQQVLLNIVINAEHFMIKEHDRGTLTITTERKDDIIRASFADDGPGIPEEDIGHIFDPFFTTKEVGKGTGLGLSICHGIISNHNGRIYAESEPGKGATFIVELPIKQEE